MKVFHSPPLRWAILVGLALFVIVGGSLFFIFYRSNAIDSRVISSNSNDVSFKDTGLDILTPEKDLALRLIDGVMVSKEESRLRPISIMVDNIPAARPSLGLAKAQLVIEAPVEAGITRFLAFYAQAEDVTVGPVRSARPYYVDWASEFGAVYAHVGGSEDGLHVARNSSVVDADDWKDQEYFWRDVSRSKPHNMYASTQRLRQYAASLGWNKESSFQMWKYFSNKEHTKIKEVIYFKEPFVLFRPGTNEVAWKYDPQSNDYVRYEMGKKHVESDGSEIRAKNIILVHMKMKILDEVGRRRFETIGQGEADIFYDGMQFSNVMWKKDSPGQRTFFFDKESGDEMVFEPGPTWIEIVPTWAVEWGVNSQK